MAAIHELRARGGIDDVFGRLPDEVDDEADDEANADWARARRLIARRIRLRGQLRPRDHLADVLIVVSAARLNGAVVTANVDHLETWAKLASAAGLDVAVVPYRP